MGASRHGWAAFAAMVVVGCSGTPPPPSAHVLRGRELVDLADTSMRADGVVFAPYSELPLLGAEETYEHYKCIEAVNQAVLVALASRYAIRPVRAGRERIRGQTWARGGTGPRVAIHVESLRCGLVVGESAYSSVASADPGGRESSLGEVMLVMHDRTTGEARIGVHAEAHDPDGLAAAQAAAASAVQAIAP